MNNFNYYNPTELVFGKDRVLELKEFIPKDTKKILLHYGGGSIKKIGLYDQVVELLKDLDISFVELGGVEPNPKLKMVRKGIDLCKEEGVDLILAVGGGSVIDSSKAIAVGALYEGDVWDFFESQEIERALPLGVILTIPATGSETSSSSVVTNEEGLLKRSIESDLIRPKFAIMDPGYTLSLSNYQTFAGITDIISHVVERYFTQTESVELTDRLCESTIKTMIDNAYKLYDQPMNYQARAEVMLAGTIAHSGILGLGREEDWASHRIAHEITALYGTTHGLTLAIIIPAWMKYVYEENLDRFARFGIEVFDIVPVGKRLEEVAREAIEEFEGFLEDISMPTSFKTGEIPTDKFELMARKATKDGSIGRFKKLEYEDVLNILNLAK